MLLYYLCIQSESSLDDDAMMAVDEALAAVFRTRFAMKHQRKQKRGEKRNHVVATSHVTLMLLVM